MIVTIVLEVNLPGPEEAARNAVAKVITRRSDFMNLADLASELGLEVDSRRVMVTELRVKHPGTVEF